VSEFSGIACSITSSLVVEILMQKQHSNKIMLFGVRGAANYAYRAL